MGFDNECILNIQSLAGEYFCPVCRTLVYPHEALQTQCTHLYCKPCLAYVVGSTQACPYDGYLVTEAGSKPLMESNKALAETIGKTTVHCLYHRSGCMWQGSLSECTSHCSACAFGNSPVVCNRCGLQIVHRQVQEHAQTCNGANTNTNTQPLGSETVQDTTVSSVDQTKIGIQTAPPPSQPQPQPQPSVTATATASGLSSIVQTAPTNPLPQGTPATDQWYQQQQQQQQQQQYQQYYQQYPGYDQYQQQQPYQQQYYPYQQPPPVHPQPQPQPQPQSQPQIQPQPPQFQMQSQAQPPVPSNVQPLYPQAAVVGSSQNHGQVNPQQVQIQPLAHGHMPPQSYSQAQPHMVTQPQMQVSQYQQPQPHPHFQPLPPPQPQSQPMNPQHPPYPPQPHQPIQQAPPMQVHPPAGSVPPPQFPQPPPPHMRPTHILPSQPPPHPRPFVQPMPQQYAQPQQVRPQGPPQPMPPPPLPFSQPQQAAALPHGMPPQSYMGRPPMLNQGGQSQQFPQPQSSGIPPHARPPQSHVYPQNQYTPPLDIKVEQQEDKPPKSDVAAANESGASFNEVKPEPVLKMGEGEGLTKDAVSDLQKVKEENKDGASDYNQSEDATIDSMNKEIDHDHDHDRSFSEPQIVGQPPTHLRPPGPFHHPEFPLNGPNNNRGYGYNPRHPMGPPPLPPGPDGPRHFDRGPFGVDYEKFRNPDAFPMGPPRHHEDGSHSSRPFSGYGMDGPPSRFLEKDRHGYPFDGPPSSGFLPPNDDHRGRFENHRPNPDFLGPMHGYGHSPGKHSFGGPHRDMERERHSFGERFGPYRGEFDGPRNRGRSGEPNGPGPGFGLGGFSFGPKPFSSSYSRHGDGGFFSGGSDSFDGLRKRKTYNNSVGWCRICKIDCESVEGLDMHGQTREHQRMAMDMVITIKQKSAKKQKSSNDHSARDEPNKLRNDARINAS